MDISDEPEWVHAMYGSQPGVSSFANNCLLARRLVEKGVRFVQLFDWGWDSHGTDQATALNFGLLDKCRQTDRPIAALLRDLEQRGLLDETLVVWGGEFGRTPMQENRNGNKNPFLGRDHHSEAFTSWLAGGGVKRGFSFGETDEIGYAGISGRPTPDLQATILHLSVSPRAPHPPLPGTSFRLTDLSGSGVKEISRDLRRHSAGRKVPAVPAGRWVAFVLGHDDARLAPPRGTAPLTLPALRRKTAPAGGPLRSAFSSAVDARGGALCALRRLRHAVPVRCSSSARERGDRCPRGYRWPPGGYDGSTCSGTSGLASRRRRGNQRRGAVDSTGCGRLEAAPHRVHGEPLTSRGTLAAGPGRNARGPEFSRSTCGAAAAAFRMIPVRRERTQFARMDEAEITSTCGAGFPGSCVSLPRPQQQKGGLRLDSLATMVKGGDRGPASFPATRHEARWCGESGCRRITEVMRRAAGGLDGARGGADPVVDRRGCVHDEDGGRVEADPQRADAPRAVAGPPSSVLRRC